MRIVIDMQGAQTESRFRGIGRYTLSFAQAVARNRGQNEVILALNGLFHETIEPIRSAFEGLLPQESIRVWCTPGPVKEDEADNVARARIAELVREAFLCSLEPDVIHITSLFEGYLDDAVTSIGRFDNQTPVSVSLYDLIPLLNRSHYLDPDQRYAEHYERKLSSLRRASLLLAISHHTREEGATCLGIDTGVIVNVSAAISPHFKVIDVAQESSERIRRKLGLTRSFVLCTGGSDQRKNVSRLIEAWASLPDDVRHSHQLLMAGKMNTNDVTRFQEVASLHGLDADELVFSGYITDEELVLLNNICKLFVFPSWHEGFGLPALEAMACGAPVIASNTTSLPEVIGLQDALFDPHSTKSMVSKMLQALTDDVFLRRLRLHSSSRAKLFSWDETAQRAIAAWSGLENKVMRSRPLLENPSNQRLIAALTQFLAGFDDAFLDELATDLAKNEAAGMLRNLLVDVSAISAESSACGPYQSRVEEELRRLISDAPKGFRVEPVFDKMSRGYCYARQYSHHLLGQTPTEAVDSPMHWKRGDLFIEIGIKPDNRLAKHRFHEQLRHEGVGVEYIDIAAKYTASHSEVEIPVIDQMIDQAVNKHPPKQLLVDISELVKHDARSGIQRVVRSILHQWWSAPPAGFRVEPVYASVTEPYRYAQQYMHGFLGQPDSHMPDHLVEVAPGDVFVSLDLQHQVAPAQEKALQTWRNNGVAVWSIVYDLLPLQFPDFFPVEVRNYHQTWLETIREFDGVICISQVVANEVKQWLYQHPRLGTRPFAVEWFHLGADLEASAPTKGWPVNGLKTLETIKARDSFLMVSTIEPRKGHEQVLDAFEQLWASAFDANLIIVGKQGWRIDALVERLRRHPEAGKRLLWLEDISDEFLEKVYAGSTCLIVASKGEGFGLPLIEAAQQGLPIIARDLPVFREVAGDHAYYFSGHQAPELSRAVRDWKKQHDQGTHPRSKGIPWLTWKQSADQLTKIIMTAAHSTTATGVHHT